MSGVKLSGKLVGILLPGLGKKYCY